MSKDTFTLEQIKRGIIACVGDEYDLPEHFFEDFEAAISEQEPKFSEGQVVFQPFLKDDRPTGDYVVLFAYDLKPHQAHTIKNCRPLNQSEVGEGWISTEKYNSVIDKYSELSEKYMELADKYSDLIGIKEKGDKLAEAVEIIRVLSHKIGSDAAYRQAVMQAAESAIDEYNNGQEG